MSTRKTIATYFRNSALADPWQVTFHLRALVKSIRKSFKKLAQAYSRARHKGWKRTVNLAFLCVFEVRLVQVVGTGVRQEVRVPDLVHGVFYVRDPGGKYPIAVPEHRTDGGLIESQPELHLQKQRRLSASRLRGTTVPHDWCV